MKITKLTDRANIDSNMKTQFFLLSIYNKAMLSLDETCAIIGICKETAYVQRCNGTFPIPMSGRPLRADIRDVALYLDAARESAR